MELMSKNFLENVFVKDGGIQKGGQRKMQVKENFVYFLMEEIRVCLKVNGKDRFNGGN